MQRRIIAAVAAVLLAGIGAVMLYNYVNTAEARAMASLDTVDVLVVTKGVPAGTSGAEIAPYIELKKLPKLAVVDGALTDTSSVTDLVTTTDLQVGEQLLASRFATPNTTTTGDVKVPSDLQLVTFQLDPSRIVGTNVAPGDKVGLFISKEENQVALTKLAFRDVLVTKVQGAPNTSQSDGNGDAAPSSDVLVTIAIAPKSAAEIVWGAEFGHIWLALEPKDGDHSTTMIVKVKNIFG